ncbi:MAG TPA: cation diffusion facilitator family transporter [Vicinamibacterales bacterium]|nr:cation diffusion facilitator family transporter [Vicinamibacterales bacterium]
MGAHHHHHHHHHRSVSQKLTVATIANVLVVIAEIGAGLYAGSLALLGDALHNLTDVVALAIALIAVRLERRAPTSVKTFGYQRAGILAAFINAGLLVAFTLFIFREAYERLQQPHAVHTTAMLIAAVVALAVNLATALSLKHESREDVNIRGAVVHMISDAVSSAGIIVAALLIRATGATQWDAIISIFIGVLILWSSYGVLKESVNLLLEGTPAGIDPDEVTRAIGAIDGIMGVHHLHIWALGPSSPALSCHLMVGDVPVKSTGKVLDEVNAMLARDYRIAHTTIQFEFAECDADDPYCVPFSAKGK